MSDQQAVSKSPAQHAVIEVPRRDTFMREAPGKLEAPGGAKREASSWIAGEPLVQDLLHDPLIHAILDRDGLDLQDLLQAIALGRSRLAPTLAVTESDAA